MRRGRSLVRVAMAAFFLVLARAHVEAQSWQGTLRLLGLFPTDRSQPVATTGSQVAAGSALAPELGLAYFVNPSLSVELAVATVTFDLTTKGGVVPGLDAGSMRVLLPSVTLQYRLPGSRGFHPYLGVGATAALFRGYSLSQDLRRFGLRTIDFNDAVRVSLQGGADVAIGKGWLLNLDLRYVPLTTKAAFRLAAGGTLGTVALDVYPLVVGVGLSRRF